MDVVIVDQDDSICHVCNAEFLEREDLEVHTRQIHLNKTNINRFCKICIRIFSDIVEYALHLRNEHLCSLKCCKYCTRLFQTTLEVQNHEKSHNISVLFPKISCANCEKIFDTKADLRAHELKQHTDSTDGLISNDCLPILSSILCMNVHDFLAARVSNLPYKCVVCKKTTTDIKLYIQHLVGKDNCCAYCAYACDQCHRVYTLKKYFTKHIQSRVHSDIDTDGPPVECKKCKCSFKASVHKTHVKTCTGMCCTLCNVYFKTVEDFTNHRFAEHDARMPSVQVCIYCQRQMVGIESLKRHVNRVHKNETHLYKYHCKDCKRIFKHPKLLFAHFFTKHKDLHPFTCRICDKTFRVRKGFTLHIKLTHNSIGFVEFDDNFHVFFTDKKPCKQSSNDHTNNKETSNDAEHKQNYNIDEECNIENNIIKNDGKKGDILEEQKNESNSNVNESCSENNEKHETVKTNNDTNQENEDDAVRSDNDCNIITDSSSLRKPVLKRKRTMIKKGTNKNEVYDVEVSSDDSDVPLKTVCKKLKLRKMKMRKRLAKSHKFICDKCNRNCYTYQNYHRHIALHTKHESKICVKCYGEFDSVRKLNEHIQKEHSSSQLTETLKQFLKRRKITEKVTKEATKLNNILQESKLIYEKVPLSTSEKFQNTIKKFNADTNMTTAKVTLKEIDKDKISVKKYLESFTPENTDAKITMIKDAVSVDTARVKRLRPFIKLTKFTEHVKEPQEIKLKMPVKFKDDLKEKCDVKIKLVSDYRQPAMIFFNEVEDNIMENYDDYTTYDTYEPSIEKEDVPEVAQEVMLEGTEEQSIVNTMSLKNLPNWHNVQIAHLSAESPYYKITKINLDTNSSFTVDSPNNEDTETVENITLPNGKTLVSVNPLKHLLDKTMMEQLQKTGKKQTKKKYYKPRIANVAEAIKTAMAKLEKPTVVKEKKKV